MMYSWPPDEIPDARVVVVMLGLGGLHAGWGAETAPEVSFESLLQEMTNRVALARLPSPWYSQGEASSHNPVANDPTNSKTWHVNNDDYHFIRTEVNNGRNEWVILDAHGPGTITRVWTPLWGEADAQIIRFYLDDSSTPQIEANFLDLISGSGFVTAPFAFISMPQTDGKDPTKPDYKPPRNNVGADFSLYEKLSLCHLKATIPRING